MQAAIWRPPGSREKTKYHHGPWHYINVPHFLTDADRSAMEGELDINLSLVAPASPETDMNIVQAIRYARRLLADDEAEEADKEAGGGNGRASDLADNAW